MSNVIKNFDPIDGLIDYFKNEIKPFHTKLIEITSESLVFDDMNVSFDESLSLCITMGAPDLNGYFKFYINRFLLPSPTNNGQSGGINTTYNTNDTITIGDDSNYNEIATLFNVGMVFDLVDSRDFNNLITNDGSYQIKEIIIDHNSKRLNLVLFESLPFTEAQLTTSSGYITIRKVDHCGILYSGNDLPRNVKMCNDGFGGIFDPYNEFATDENDNEGFDLNPLEQYSYDSATLADSFNKDDGAPYDIIEVSGGGPNGNGPKYFVIAGDYVQFFPYGRRFDAIESDHGGTYFVHLSVLDDNGNTRIYPMFNLLNDFTPTTVKPTDGKIITPGHYDDNLLYGYGFDHTEYCSDTESLSVNTAFHETLTLRVEGEEPVITNPDDPNAIAGWDNFSFESVLWDTEIPNYSVDNPPPATGAGFDPPDGYDNQFDI